MKRNESIWHALTAGIDAKVERKKLWYVISSRNRWGVHKRYGKRSLRNFKHRELAFLYAVRYAKNRDVRIIVHDTDGCVDFTYNNLKDGRN